MSTVAPSSDVNGIFFLTTNLLIKHLLLMAIIVSLCVYEFVNIYILYSLKENNSFSARDNPWLTILIKMFIFDRLHEFLRPLLYQHDQKQI